MRLLLLLTGLLVVNFLYSQIDNRLPDIVDEWYDSIGSKGLRVGDTVPEVLLKKIINNRTGKNKLSDFKGKLLILDFWDTYCSACIASFPRMEKLQREFEGQIQILLVNPRETESQIEERFKRDFKGKFKLPDLPCAVADSAYQSKSHYKYPLYRLFPSRGFPHHVWIDENGIVKLRGDAMNTHADKIRDYLSGKEIFVLNSSATMPSMIGNSNIPPYYTLLGSFKKTKPRLASIITPYNNEVDAGNGFFREIFDSTNNTKIIQFINSDLLDIYEFGPFKQVLQRYIQGRILYGPTNSVGADIVIFPHGIDSLKYSSRSYVAKKKLTDLEYIRSKYCYEQVMPMELPESIRRESMLNDLNLYFGNVYGIVASIEERPIPCYVLIRTSQIDKIATTKSLSKIYETKKNGNSVAVFESVSLKSVVQDILRQNLRVDSLLYHNKSNDLPFLIMNNTNWSSDKKIDIKLSSRNIDSIDSLRKAFQEYDLDIVEKNVNVEFIVFKKKELNPSLTGAIKN